MPLATPGYSVAPPTVGADGTITVSQFVNAPVRVQRSLELLTLNRFLLDQVFAKGPDATTGAVLYDQLTAGDFYLDQDVKSIAEGAEFPILGGSETVPLVAAVTKWGGAALVTYEAERRNRIDKLNRELRRLSNTVVRKVDTVAMATLNAAPVHTATAAADWTGGSAAIIDDLEGARTTIDEQDMGYEADTVLINPAQALDVRTDATLRAALPRESVGANLLGTSDLNGLLRFRTWYVSNRVPAGTVWVLASKVVGSYSDEIPGGFYSRVVDEPTFERRRVMGARIVTPYVTDPKAAVKITGA